MPTPLEYHSPPPHPRRPIFRALITFAAGYAAAGIAVCAWAVYAWRQGNSYLGAELSLGMDSFAVLLAAALALGSAALTAHVVRKLAKSDTRWRHPILCAAGGAFCAVATFAPDVIDTHLTGVFDVGSGNSIPSGRGGTVGWISFVACPPLVALALLRRRPPTD